MPQRGGSQGVHRGRHDIVCEHQAQIVGRGREIVFIGVVLPVLYGYGASSPVFRAAVVVRQHRPDVTPVRTARPGRETPSTEPQWWATTTCGHLQPQAAQMSIGREMDRFSIDTPALPHQSY
jgi:hypothetical protein